MKRIKDFIVKHRIKVIITIVAVILILCAVFISKQFLLAFIGLMGLPAVKGMDKIKDLQFQRKINKESLNEKDVLDNTYNDTDLSSNESVKYIKKRIRDRKNKS